MKLPILVALGTIGFAVGITACSPEPMTQPTANADLRLVHADAAAGAIDVVVAGKTVLQGISYGHTSAVAQVPSGMQHVVVNSGGQMLAELDANISGSIVNSLLVSASSVQFATDVVPDTGAVITSRANIRMVNVASSNTADPTLLDVKVTAPGVDSVMTFGVDTKIARYGTLMYFDPGAFTFSYYPTGDPTLLTQLTFNVGAGEAKAVILERDAGGVYHASVVADQ